MTIESENNHANPDLESESSAVSLPRQSSWLAVGLGLLGVILIVALAWPGLRNRLSIQPNSADEASLTELKQTAAAAPENDTLQYELAGAYYQAGRFEEAWDQLRTAQTYRSAAEAEPEIREAEQAVQANPKSKEAHFKLGTIWARARLLAPAEIAFQQAIALDPTYTDAHANLGAIYYQMGRLSDALHEYDTVLDQHPNDADVHYNKGVVFVQQALQVSPPDEALLSKGVEEFERALEIDSNLAQAHFSMGVVHTLRSEKQEAIDEFQRFLELDDGSDPEATNGAHTYLNQLKQ